MINILDIDRKIKLQSAMIRALAEAKDEKDQKDRRILIAGLVLFLYPFIVTALLNLYSWLLSITVFTIVISLIIFILDILSHPVVFVLSFSLSAGLGGWVLVKTKAKNLCALTLTFLGLLFVYAYTYIYLI